MKNSEKWLLIELDEKLLGYKPGALMILPEADCQKLIIGLIWEVGDEFVGHALSIGQGLSLKSVKHRVLYEVGEQSVLLNLVSQKVQIPVKELENTLGSIYSPIRVALMQPKVAPKPRKKPDSLSEQEMCFEH